MAKLPLSQTVEASTTQRSWQSSIFSLATSTAIECLFIAVVVVTPLLVAQTLPEPRRQLTLPRFVSVDIAPPVAARPVRPRKAEPTQGSPRSPTIPVDWLELPVDVPETIVDNDPYFSSGDPLGVTGGLPPNAGAPTSTPSLSTRPAVEEEPQPLRITGDIQPPSKIVHVNPVYPPIARAARIQGTVRLQAIIDIDGNVSNLRIIESVTLLDQAAIEAVRQWRYEPTRHGGRAVPVIMTVEVTFQLR